MVIIIIQLLQIKSMAISSHIKAKKSEMRSHSFHNKTLKLRYHSPLLTLAKIYPFGSIINQKNASATIEMVKIIKQTIKLKEYLQKLLFQADFFV